MSQCCRTSIFAQNETTTNLLYEQNIQIKGREFGSSAYEMHNYIIHLYTVKSRKYTDLNNTPTSKIGRDFETVSYTHLTLPTTPYV